jgi:hypothetical protein
MTDEAALVLANCLDALERREFTLDEYVARHPDQYTVLTELVPVAQRLRAAPDVRPSPDFRADARQRLIARLPSRAAPRSRWPWPQPGVLVRALAALLIVIVLGSSVVAASAQSLPNEVLYPVKITVEQMRLALSPDQLTRSELSLGFADERLIEVQRLIDRGQGNETADTLDAFAAQIQSAAEIAHGLPISVEREALLTRLHRSIDRSAKVLDDSEASLPASVQPAITRAREALLAVPPENAPQPLPPTTTPTPTPTMTARPPALPTRSPFPTATPEPGTTPTPQSTHMPHTPVVTIHWPTLLPTRWPTGLPTYWPTPVVTWHPTYVPPTISTRPPNATPEPWPTLPTRPPHRTPSPIVTPLPPPTWPPIATVTWPTPIHR